MSEPRERGIQFSGAMVQALLAGRKTVTRRLTCRYKVGDLLYVRETYSVCDHADTVIYRADCTGDTCTACGDSLKGLWHQAMFMPKWAARDWRGEVTDIHEERLNEITEEQAIAEGVEVWRESLEVADWEQYSHAEFGAMIADPVECFAALWNSLHGPDAWAANPVVYAISL